MRVADFLVQPGGRLSRGARPLRTPLSIPGPDARGPLWVSTRLGILDGGCVRRLEPLGFKASASASPWAAWVRAALGRPPRCFAQDALHVCVVSPFDREAARREQGLEHTSIPVMARVGNALEGGDGVTEFVGINLEGHGRRQRVGEPDDLHRQSGPTPGQEDWTGHLTSEDATCPLIMRALPLHQIEILCHDQCEERLVVGQNAEVRGTRGDTAGEQEQDDQAPEDGARRCWRLLPGTRGPHSLLIGCQGRPREVSVRKLCLLPFAPLLKSPPPSADLRKSSACEAALHPWGLVVPDRRPIMPDRTRSPSPPLTDHTCPLCLRDLTVLPFGYATCRWCGMDFTPAVIALYRLVYGRGPQIPGSLSPQASSAAASRASRFSQTPQEHPAARR